MRHQILCHGQYHIIGTLIRINACVRKLSFTSKTVDDSALANQSAALSHRKLSMELSINSSFIVIEDFRRLEKRLEQPLPSSVDTEGFKLVIGCRTYTLSGSRQG